MFSKKALLENAVKRLKSQADLLYNTAGFKIDIDTLTSIKSQVTGQKFYEVKPSDFMPVIVGEGAFSDQLLTYKDFSIGGDFEGGLIEPGSNRSRKQSDDTRIEGIIVPVKHWAKKVEYNLIELAQASKSGNWSLIEAKEKARYKDWQLGIQQVAFLGLETSSLVGGLLTQTDVNSNTTTITKNISDMNSTEFQAFLKSFLADYWENSNATVYPDSFVLPSDDYNGLAVSPDETYPLKSKLQRIKEAAIEITGNADFKVAPLAYAQKERNSAFLGSGLGLNRYCLYRKADSESLRIDIPVDFTTTIQDTMDGFEYSSTAYAGFTGCKAYRPREVLYFDHSN